MADASGPRYALRAFRSRDFAVFWTGGLLSNTGTWLANLAVPVVVYDLTRSALWVGIVALVQLVPTGVLAPWAGALGDRFPRRRVLLWTQAGMLLCAVALWVVWAAGVREIWAILIPIAAQGVFAGLNAPSWQSYVHDLVPREDVRSAVTFNSLQFNLSRVLGPALGGVLLASVGATWTFFANAVSFLFVLIALLIVRTDGTAHIVREGALRGFASAGRIIWLNRPLRVSVGVAMAVGLLGNPMFNLSVVLAEEVYGVDEFALGMLNAAVGVGAVLAVPLVAGMSARATIGSVVALGVAAYGIAFLTIGLIDVYAVGVVGFVLAGAAFLSTISSTNTVLQLRTPDAFRGRVLALRGACYFTCIPLGAVLQSAIAEWAGVRWSMAVAGAGFAVVLAVLLFPRRSSRLSSLDIIVPQSVFPDAADQLPIASDAGEPDSQRGRT